MENTKSHLTLENRNSLTITGIKKVKTTEPNCVVAQLDSCIVVVSGSGLSVQNLSVRDGLLEISGNVMSIKYTKAHNRGFSLKNMFR